MDGLPRLDRIDIKILAQLQQNGNLTNVDLAEKVGLSPSPCLARVKRLEKAGYIAGYNARINLVKLTEFVTVFTQITLNDHKREDFVKFENEIKRYDFVQECYMVSGGYDYLLKFVCRSIAIYHRTMENILDRNIGVEKYFSYVTIKSVFERSSVSIISLLESSYE